MNCWASQLTKSAKTLAEKNNRMFNSTKNILLLLLCLCILLCAPFAGMRFISPASVISSANGEFDIFWRMRVPRVLLAFVAGGALSFGGMCFQSVFRNSLATPYTLGVSGGAAFCVSLVVMTGPGQGVLAYGLTEIAAFTGALAASFAVLALSRLRRIASNEHVLLAGVAASFLFSSGIMFMQYIGNANGIVRVMHWMLGSVAVVGYSDIAVMLLPVVLALGILVTRFHDLDLLLIGEEYARSRGVNTKQSCMFIFIAVSIMVGAVVSICGPIGFVGMICPHICRIILGQRHAKLAFASFCFGGGFLVLCDMIGRIIAAPSELPVGIVTSLLGAPFFLCLLLFKKHRA